MCIKEGVVQSPGDIILHTSFSAYTNILKLRKGRSLGCNVDTIFTLDNERFLSSVDTLEIGSRQTPHQNRQAFPGLYIKTTNADNIKQTVYRQIVI